MVTIIFEPHATTIDNEAGRVSGHYDVELSALGEEQAKELGERRKTEDFAAIFCSDLQRAYKTAEIAFGDKFEIVKDVRLRECDYGDLNNRPKKEVDPFKLGAIKKPFPGGESYEQCNDRMKSFLFDLLKDYDGKKVMVIGHRATQYGLECLINGVSLEKITTAPWQWQPGWQYTLEKI